MAVVLPKASRKMFCASFISETYQSFVSLQKFSDICRIRIVRAMISRHPFDKWPLQVKIFTEEVANIWKKADLDPALALPPGFTYTVELEGVDGKSGHPGTGRTESISIDDGALSLL